MLEEQVSSHHSHNLDPEVSLDGWPKASPIDDELIACGSGRRIVHVTTALVQIACSRQRGKGPICIPWDYTLADSGTHNQGITRMTRMTRITHKTGTIQRMGASSGFWIRQRDCCWGPSACSPV